MPDIGYRLSEPIKRYVTGEMDKTEFKQEIRNMENRTEGANWWTISTAAANETDKPNHPEVAEPLSEMYKNEDLMRVFGSDVMEQIK